ncbi:MAG: hypothetical protein Tsb0014_20660 [Pleurocapsa sp.]
MLVYEINYVEITYAKNLMNPLLARFLRSVYRKEPISGFILILGITDAIIGGFGGQGSLLSVGLIIALVGVAIRWQQRQRVREKIVIEPPRKFLPPSPSRPPLPLLISKKNRH